MVNRWKLIQVDAKSLFPTCAAGGPEAGFWEATRAKALCSQLDEFTRDALI